MWDYIFMRAASGERRDGTLGLETIDMSLRISAHLCVLCAVAIYITKVLTEHIYIALCMFMV